MIAKDAPYRKGNVGGGENRRGHLIKERLKEVVIFFINQHHIDGCVCQRLHRGNTSKPTANDNDDGRINVALVHD